MDPTLAVDEVEDQGSRDELADDGVGDEEAIVTTREPRAVSFGDSARRKATRSAILSTMESFNLITMTRGDARLPCPQD